MGRTRYGNVGQGGGVVDVELLDGVGVGVSDPLGVPDELVDPDVLVEVDSPELGEVLLVADPEVVGVVLGVPGGVDVVHVVGLGSAEAVLGALDDGLDDGADECDDDGRDDGVPPEAAALDVPEEALCDRCTPSGGPGLTGGSVGVWCGPGAGCGPTLGTVTPMTPAA